MALPLPLGKRRPTATRFPGGTSLLNRGEGGETPSPTSSPFLHDILGDFQAGGYSLQRILSGGSPPMELPFT